MPMSGIAGETTTPVEKSTGAKKSHSQAGSQSGAGSASKDRKGKKSDQKNVQTRGLFTKKKNKNTAGGHAQPPEQTDPPGQGEPGMGK
jgi:hypothetical protein